MALIDCKHSKKGLKSRKNVRVGATYQHWVRKHKNTKNTNQERHLHHFLDRSSKLRYLGNIFDEQIEEMGTASNAYEPREAGHDDGEGSIVGTGVVEYQTNPVLHGLGEPHAQGG